MHHHRPIALRRNQAAFSLPEVVMAVGIVATIALPVLAMLGDGSAMQALARDRETAARIAREAGASLFPLKDGSGYEFHATDGTRHFLARPTKGETALHLAHDAEGRFIGPIEENEFRSGIQTPHRAHHFLRLRLAGSSGASPTDLIDLELSVEQPAAAKAELRSRERYTSRLTLP